MRCPNCGDENFSFNAYCSGCGNNLESEQARQENPKYINNHLVKAIVATIFFFLPFGVVAIVYASQVNGMKEKGDYEAARKLSRSANNWANASIIIWVSAVLFFVLIGFVS